MQGMEHWLSTGRTYTLEGRFTNAEGVHQGAKSVVATMGTLGNGVSSMHVIECKMSNENTCAVNNGLMNCAIPSFYEDSEVT